MDSPCSTGHRQKIEDQTKAFPDRFGDLRMRVTPSTPSPRGSLSTTSHFSSQAQTPIQGTEEQRPAGSRQGVDKDPGYSPSIPGHVPGEDGSPTVYWWTAGAVCSLHSQVS